MSNSLHKGWIFIFSFGLFYLFLLLSSEFGSILQSIYRTRFPSLYLEMNNLNLPVPWHPEIALDYIGFLVPLGVSVILLVLSWRIRPSFSAHEKRSFLTYTMLFILGELISAILPEVLKASWEMFQTDGGLNLVASIIACIYGPYIISTKSEKFSYMVTYIVVFLMTAASDVSAVLAGTVGVFGGYGFTDGDFIEPLMMALSAFGIIISIRLVKKMEEMRKV